MLFTTPIYANASTKLKLNTRLYTNDNSNLGHCHAAVFITDDLTINGQLSMGTYGNLTDSRLLVLRDINVQSTYVNYNVDTNLADLMASKYTDLSKPYYIGFWASSVWAGFYGQVECTTCETY